MAIYNIKTQLDLELYPIIATASDTCILRNDITMDTKWMPIGTLYGTFDGNGYAIKSLTSRPTDGLVVATHSGGSASFTATNYGTVHTIFVNAPLITTGDGYYVLFGNTDEKYGQLKIYYKSGRPAVFTTIYTCGDGTNSESLTWTGHARIIIRNGLSVTAYNAVGTSLGTQTLTNNYDFTANVIAGHISGTWGISIQEILVTSDAKDTTWLARKINGAVGSYTTTGQTPNLVSLWRMDEGSGNTLEDSIGSKDATGTITWGERQLITGFVNILYGEMKNLTIVSPNITNAITANAKVAPLVNQAQSNSTIKQCSATGVTLSAVYTNTNQLGGLIASSDSSVISDCYVTVTSIPRTQQATAGQTGWSGGFIGYAFNTFFYRCYVYGTNTTTKPDSCFAGNSSMASGAGGVINCWVSIPADAFVITFWYSTFSNVTNLHYTDISKPIDNKGNTGTTVSPVTKFYSKTQPPMDTWNFTTVWQEIADDFPKLYRIPISDGLNALFLGHF